MEAAAIHGRMPLRPLPSVVAAPCSAREPGSMTSAGELTSCRSWSNFWPSVSPSDDAAGITEASEMCSSSVGWKSVTSPASPSGRSELVSNKRSNRAAAARASRRGPRMLMWVSIASLSLSRSPSSDAEQKTNSWYAFSILMHWRGFPVSLVTRDTDSMGPPPGFCVSKAKEAVRSLTSTSALKKLLPQSAFARHLSRPRSTVRIRGLKVPWPNLRTHCEYTGAPSQNFASSSSSSSFSSAGSALLTTKAMPVATLKASDMSSKGVGKTSPALGQAVKSHSQYAGVFISTPASFISAQMPWKAQKPVFRKPVPLRMRLKSPTRMRCGNDVSTAFRKVHAVAR
mmetsp:Transcript_44119/g.119013  ORF Transcript_44119/g.119013 Transcript_44119/m.119013 type:complete len:342 (+) Transcript_44119:160-1185(+)